MATGWYLSLFNFTFHDFGRIRPPLYLHVHLKFTMTDNNLRAQDIAWPCPVCNVLCEFVK